MGGMSFKCPKCDKWFLTKGPLKNHLKDKHQQTPHFKIEGVGSNTYIKPE